MPGPKSNNVTIRLTEAAVYLRTDDSAGRRRIPDSRPALLRGLLILDLAKPTRITSIDLKLQACSSISWPEGYGARRTDVTERSKVFSISSTLFTAELPARRTASVGPGVAYLNEDAHDDLEDDPLTLPRARSRGAVRGVDSPRAQRPPSTDSAVPRRPREEVTALPEIPPYSRHPPTLTPSGSLTSIEHPALSPTHSSTHLETVEEYPPGTEHIRDALGQSPAPLINSSASSVRSYREGRSLSRRLSIDDSYEVPSGPSTTQNSPQLTPTLMPGDGIRSPSESRGRRKSARFSFSSVLDAVRSSSPRVTRSRERSVESPVARGRTRVKGAQNESDESPIQSLTRPMGSKERISNILGDIWKSEPEERKTEGEGWKEFKAGTYTYPISFTIPANAPPSLQCSSGSVSWSLSAVAHRQGALTSKLEAHREVTVVSCPTEEDTEDTENIIVERHWDSQLQYLITVSGRSFYIGGKMPITFTFMPLSKMKIHRVSIVLEEKTEYMVGQKVVRTDAPSNLVLLAVRHDDKKGVSQPILPLESDQADVLKNSPLQALIRPEDDLSEMASSLMGPGPWTFQQDLRLPSSCRVLHFTNKNKKSNILVSHVLKFVIRVESGDTTAVETKAGKKKLFDIVVQTPIHILSCRCNPEWTSLPHYTTSFEDPATVAHLCPCQHSKEQHPHHPHKRPGRHNQSIPVPVVNISLEPTLTHHSSDSESAGSASGVETHPVDSRTMRSLRDFDSVVGRTNLYERLISGQEGILGEAPPAYSR